MLNMQKMILYPNMENMTFYDFITFVRLHRGVVCFKIRFMAF